MRRSPSQRRVFVDARKPKQRMYHQTSTTETSTTLEHVAHCALPTPWATFELHAFVEKSTGKEHLALTLGAISDGQPVLARLHSECLTGDTLFSLRCDCGTQLESALKQIAKEGRGILLYLRQEGRGIGLVNKIRAYGLQELGADTVEANHQLGFADDLRNYVLCGPIFQYFNVQSLRLMTNNPRKITALEEIGLHIERVEHVAGSTRFNSHYLATKANKLGHLLPQASASAPTSETVVNIIPTPVTKK
jgi:GTP cyclohydrolase II